ncbi:protein POLAR LOCALIZATION DURING ASYMMETRIC DIVISION AND REDISTRIBUTION-like [Tripterygium wilfordii]|uniref:Protein POLAR LOCALIZATION DURING ASYMMETRIC DIVISION AND REDISTRIBUTION-like n=1 Tax=Tripterygium wilfordii TaxID=458696 RepID=A0A7J7BXK4_TRIWF|nr:protein POLAR-like 1 [Tripterygium wilfordii]KAF5726276.1 protein POLAR LOCALIZATION DURING ASYMMETRIC DIVISION AND REDISTRIBUTION-like [Tripterygium wilfordii]
MNPIFNDRRSSYISPDNPSVPLRILDVLHQNDDDFEELSMDDGGEGCWVSQYSSPRRISSVLKRCFKGKKSNVAVKNEKRREEVGREGLNDQTTVAVSRSIEGFNGVNPSASVQDESRQCTNEMSFNLGVGCYLLHLIAASKEELNKMMELRGQMEVLVGNVKKELERKETYAYSTTDAQEGPICDDVQLSTQIFGTSYGLRESSTTTVCNQSLKCSSHRQDGCSGEMDQLEVELEAELKLLQLHTASEKRREHPHEDEKSQDTVIETASPRSCGESSGEVVDHVNDAGNGVYEGVCPYELERRLHELLEARQEEHIRKLEAALESANHKIREKEIEVSWWKDTAQLISHHIPETSRLSSQHEPDSCDM